MYGGRGNTSDQQAVEQLDHELSVLSSTDIYPFMVSTKIAVNANNIMLSLCFEPLMKLISKWKQIREINN